jgi:predicted Zn-dependent protease
MVCVPPAGATAGGQPGPEARPTGRELDDRVATIGHRLAISNLAWCHEREWLPGVTLGVENPAVASRTGPRLRAMILAIARDGPAARAGLMANDMLETVDGRPLPAATIAGSGAVTGMEQVRDAFDAAFADGSARLVVRRAAASITVGVSAEHGCASRFLILPSRRLNAFANGRSVQITSRLAEETDREDELAAILAHEFAHHVLRHRTRLDAAGVARGVMRNFGRNARLIRATEEEADRLSVWLLARAGYDPQAAARFWTRFGRQGFNLLGSPTHGGWRGRVARIEAEIAAMRAAGPNGRPDFLPAAN